MDKITSLKQLRLAMMDFASSVSDTKAARYPTLFPSWKQGVLYSENTRCEFGGKLYKCMQLHTSQSGWEPASASALWTAIDIEHAGTFEDPIPASRGMEYIYGKYYLDGEDNKIYLCSRVGEADGGTIVLQYMPHELAGQYFDEAVS